MRLLGICGVVCFVVVISVVDVAFVSVVVAGDIVGVVIFISYVVVGFVVGGVIFI